MRLVLLALAVPVIAAIVVVVTLTTTDDDTSFDVGAGSTTRALIDIRSFQYEPDPLVVSSGERVVVVNSDDTVHTVTSDERGVFDTGDLSGDQRATLSPLEPGTYDYFCAIHNYMRGSIRVTDQPRSASE